MQTDPAGALGELLRLSAAAELEARQNGVVSAYLYGQLADATNGLISYRLQDATFAIHPHEVIRRRTLPMSHEVERRLRGATVLVTGAAGTIGTALSTAIAGLRPRRIIALDCRASELSVLRDELLRCHPDVAVEACNVNVCSTAELEAVFKTYRPTIVYHLAAQRQPALAESRVQDTVLTNMLGTKNVCELSDEFGVGNLVHASSGKCRFVHERRVYFATKKFGEVIAKMTADQSRTHFAIVRFHHIIENSIVESIFREQIAAERPLSVHLSRNMRQPAQNVREAVAMLLNAGVYGSNCEVFACAQDLDCFSVLELALYDVHASGKRIPIVLGRPKTLDRDEFAPSPAWLFRGATMRATDSFNHMELETVATINEAALLRARFPAFEWRSADRHISDVLRLFGSPHGSVDAGKAELYNALAELAADMSNRASPPDLAPGSEMQAVRPNLPLSASQLLT
jgi:nucleoside-diphosphate-sugar epimerase